MSIKKIVLAIALIAALILTINSALADISVTTQPGTATEGKLYTYDINVNISDASFTSLQADGFAPKNSPQMPMVNQSSGVFTWIPAAGDTGDKKFKVTITNNANKETKEYSFTIKVEPVLDITSLKIGKTGGILTAYKDGETTSAFKPGDNVTIEMTVANKYTEQSHELISKSNPNDPSLKATIENIKLVASVDQSLTNFPLLQDKAPNPFFLLAEQQQTISSTYEIPLSIVKGTYSMTFSVDGDDLVLPPPGNQYHTQKNIKLNITQNSYDVMIKSAALQKSLFTCEEKKLPATLTVDLANIGLADEEVKVVVTNDALGIKEEQVKTAVKASSNPAPGTNTVTFNNLAFKKLAGEETLTTKVYKKSDNTLYDTKTVSVTAANCPAEITPFSVTFAEDTSKSINLSNYVTNLEDKQTLTYKTEGAQNIAASFNGNMMALTPKKDWFGVESFTLIVNDGVDESKKTNAVSVTVTQNKSDDLPGISKTSPEDVKVIKENENLELSATITNPDEMLLSYNWYVDDANQNVNSNKFIFNAAGFKVGQHTIKLIVNEGKSSELKHSWVITTADRPVDLSAFPGLETSDISKLASESINGSESIKAVNSFTLDNNFGKIQFAEKVDLSEILYLANVVAIEDGQAAVDSANAPMLNKKATITLKKVFSNPLIQKSSGYKTGSFVTCVAPECVQVSNANGKYVFTVAGFSTYKVVEKQPAGFQISEVLFDNVDRGKTANASVKIKNTGTNDALTNFKLEFASVNSEYNAKILTQVPLTLAAGQEITVNLQISVPDDEDSGKHSIGLLRASSDQAVKEATVYVNPKSHLTIESIEINGDDSGELSIEEINKIEVQVQNDYTEDMENVLITAKILDVNDEDLEEQTDEFDLDQGKDSKKTLEFDLSGEDLDEAEYTLEITVEGEAKDDTNHKTVETRVVKVDRKSHQLIIKQASLSEAALQCSKLTTLYVTIENIGKSTEDDVEIKVKNAALGIDLNKVGIDIDDFSSPDNEHKATFVLEISNNAKAGTYPLTIEVYRDEKEEATATVNLEIKDCLSSGSSSQSGQQYSESELAAMLQSKLAEYKSTKQQQEAPVVKSSFRESDTYAIMLATVLVLVLIALMLGVAVLLKGKARKSKKENKEK
ncbi:MAG: Ig-like domain-containing protein [Nanoarchaeota archaeon]